LLTFFSAWDGGSHEMPGYVAEQLMAATPAGARSLKGLMRVASDALASIIEQTVAKTA
jgi:hypothetical protein